MLLAATIPSDAGGTTRGAGGVRRVRIPGTGYELPVWGFDVASPLVFIIIVVVLRLKRTYESGHL